jgi:Txe/YoeB family toxin of Txe-Axe toxin-antitoxin module
MEKAHLYEALYLVNHGIDEAVRGVQRLRKSPKLFMETYHKSMAGLERRRSMINLQFMLEMRKLEEDDECRFAEEYNVWLSDEPLTNDEICRLMREVERQRKQEGKPPLVQFLTSKKRSRKIQKENRAVHSSRKPNGAPPPATGVKSSVSGGVHE